MFSCTPLAKSCTPRQEQPIRPPLPFTRRLIATSASFVFPGWCSLGSLGLDRRLEPLHSVLLLHPQRFLLAINLLGLDRALGELTVDMVGGNNNTTNKNGDKDQNAKNNG